jgi:hypothetical protein
MRKLIVIVGILSMLMLLSSFQVAKAEVAFSEVSPADGATDVAVNTLEALSVYVTETTGAVVTVNISFPGYGFYQSETDSEPNSTFSLSDCFPAALENCTEYEWFVNVWSDREGIWTNTSYHFTTAGCPVVGGEELPPGWRDDGFSSSKGTLKDDDQGVCYLSLLFLLILVVIIYLLDRKQRMESKKKYRNRFRRKKK